jgi:hypothetical protein
MQHLLLLLLLLLLVAERVEPCTIQQLLLLW